jgi:nucleoside-diphosphate-sugar epimerase
LTFLNGIEEGRMRALVTGGTGYLGSFLVREWAQQYGPDAVVCLVPLGGTAAEIATQQAFTGLGIRCVQGDLRRCPVADDLNDCWDVLFHLAAATDTSLSEQRLAPVNVEGTANLLASLKGRLGGKRLVFTSTSAAVDRADRPSGPLTEASPCRPRTAYGRTKLAAERMVQQWCAREQVDYTIVRLTTLYGPGVRTGLIPVLADGLRQGRLAARIDWPGRVSLLFIEDAVRLLPFLATAPEAANEVFFLTSGQAVRVGDLARQIGNMMNVPIAPLRLPAWCWQLARRLVWMPGLTRLVPWRLLHILDDGLWCDNAKARRLYPFARVGLEEGLRRTFQPAAAMPPESEMKELCHAESA